MKKPTAFNHGLSQSSARRLERTAEGVKLHMQNTRSSAGKSNRVHLVADNPQPGIHLIGLAPSAEMVPDEYISNCVNVVFYRFKKQVFLDHQIIEGPHAGTVLPQWINNVSDRINPRSAFAKQCAAALGRELSVNDDLDPVAVFKGKNFRVWVGWRMSVKPKGGRFDEKLALYRKDDQDQLKVHAIIGPVEL
jgi:hypothetical protein